MSSIINGLQHPIAGAWGRSPPVFCVGGRMSECPTSVSWRSFRPDPNPSPAHRYALIAVPMPPFRPQRSGCVLFLAKGTISFDVTYVIHSTHGPEAGGPRAPSKRFRTFAYGQ